MLVHLHRGLVAREKLGLLVLLALVLGAELRSGVDQPLLFGAALVGACGLAASAALDAADAVLQGARALFWVRLPRDQRRKK